jgi:hypothetical protein
MVVVVVVVGEAAVTPLSMVCWFTPHNLPHHHPPRQGVIFRTMRFPCTPIPDSGIPNSEIRMAYGESGIPHHEIAGPRGAPGRAGRDPRAGKGGDRTRDDLCQ